MPTFNSAPDGKWYPAEEEVVVTPKDGSSPFIYKGKDREASIMIAKEHGVSAEEAIEKNLSIGVSVYENPDILALAQYRNMSVEEYIKRNQPTKEQEALRQKEQAKIITHSNPTPKPAVEPIGSKGGFYDPQKTDALKEFNKKG